MVPFVSNRKNASLSRQVNDSFTFSVVFLFGFLAIGTFAWVYRQQMSSIQERGKALQEELATSLAYPLFSFDEPTVKAITNSFLSDPLIDKVQILDEQGRIISEVIDPQTLHVAPTPSFSQEIKSGDRKVGIVNFWMNYNSVKKNLLYYGLVLASTLILTALILYYRTLKSLKSRVWKPLSELLNYSEELRQGHYQAKLPKTFNSYEFNLLFSSLETMGSAIASRDRIMQEKAANLEEEVKIKTEELLAQKEAAATSARLASIGEMAAGIAHEINNPLAIIMGKALILLKLSRANKLQDSELQKEAEKIIETSKRIEKIVRSMRTLSRGGKSDEKVPVCLQNIVKEMVSLLETKIKHQCIRVTLNGFDKESIVLGSEVQLSQVCANLINNAIDAIDDLSEKWVEIKIEERNQFYEISFCDSGQGIPASVLKHLMTPFFTTKPVGKGTGLGLSISRKIIAEHGGELVYDSARKNTCFILRLPKPTAAELEKAA